MKFVARNSNGSEIFLTDSAAVLLLTKRESGASKWADETSLRPATDVVRMELNGSTHARSTRGVDQLPGTANYFIGNDPAKWRVNLPTYAKVKYAAVYPGVDLVYYGNGQHLEYDFVVAPGADPNAVGLHFAGADRLTVDTNGNLTITSRNGSIALRKPVVFQTKDGKRQFVDGNFQLMAANNIRFRLGAYDHSRELVIDPTLEYSTYLGGAYATGTGIAVDAAGNAYITGTTGSPFPVTRKAFEKVLPGSGGSFVTKLNAAGTALVYSTYLGGDRGDSASAIAVDAIGNAYVTGTALSSDFPVTKNAFQKVNRSPNLGNVFLTKLNPAGSALVYSTYLGGSGYDDGRYSFGDQSFSVAVDKKGEAYVTGMAYSHDFPVTPNAFQTVNDVTGEASTAFVAEFNRKGSGLIYSTYLGGSFAGGVPDFASASSPTTATQVPARAKAPRSRVRQLSLSANPDLIMLAGDFGSAVALDATGNAYVTGFTMSMDFPVTPNAFQGHIGSVYATNAFVTKLDPTGTNLVYSTYLGGTNYDLGTAIAVDQSGNAYVTGESASTDFPITSNAFQKVNYSPGAFIFDSFVTKLNSSGSALVYSTFLGGHPIENLSVTSGDDELGIALDDSGNAYVVGMANSSDFPVTDDAFQKLNNAVAEDGSQGSNGVFTILNATGSALLYSTYLGGSSLGVGGNEEGAYAIAVDRNGSVYLTGLTASTDFPVTPHAFQQTNKGTEGVPGINAFVSKFNF